MSPKPSKHSITPKKTPIASPSLEIGSIPLTSSIRRIKLVAFRGGGAKGVGDVGAITELERLGIIGQLEEVAGSSVGGIVAMLIALGISAKEIETEMLSLNFRSFQDKASPGWIESTGLKEALKTSEIVAKKVGEKADLLKQIIPIVGMVVGIPPVIATGAAEAGRIAKVASGGFGKAARVFEIAEKIEDVAGVLLGSDLGLWKGEVLSNWLSEIIARKTGNPNLTFRELEHLSQGSKNYISPFKKLTVTVSNLTDGRLEYRNAEYTPDESIVDAVRQSASYPFGFQAIQKKDKDGKVKIYVDGGLLQNLPHIFHEAPYLTKENTNEQGGNKDAFALTFEAPGEKEPKVIKKGVDVLKAMYEAVISEDENHKKYGLNIAAIQTGDVGTLEFDLTPERKQALIEAGSLAVTLSLKTILEKEQNEAVDYSEKPTEELVRLHVAFQEMQEQDPEKDYLTQRARINAELIKRNPPADFLEALRKKEKERIIRSRKLSDPNKLSTFEEASNHCKQKRQELQRVEKELRNKSRQFYIARSALILRRSEIVGKFRENTFGNEFYKELKELHKFQEGILENRRLAAEIEPRESKKIEEEHRRLQIGRENFLNGLILKYRTSEDSTLSVFFQSLLEECAEIDFEIPHASAQLLSYFNADIELCSDFIAECKRLAKKTKKDLFSYKHSMDGLNKTSETSEKLSQLYHINMELEKSIYQKTNFLVKANGWLLENAPRLEKIVTPFVKLVAFAAFIVWLPVSVPWEYFNSISETRSIARRFTDFMRLTDANFRTQQLGLSRITKELVDIVSRNYVDSPNITESQLYLFHTYYMEKTGIRISDVFIRDPNNTPEQRKKIEEAQKKLEKFAPVHPKERVLKDELLEGDANRMTKIAEFRTEVLTETLRLKEHERQNQFGPEVREQYLEWVKQQRTQKYKEEAPTDPKLKQYSDIIKLHQLRSIHLQFINEMETKLQRKEKLSAKEVKEALESARITGKELSERFQRRYYKKLSGLSEQETPKPSIEREDPAKTKRDNEEAFAAFLKEKRRGKHDRHKGWRNEGHKT